MFDVHQKEIGEFARADAANMYRVITFVHATVQQQLNVVSDCMESIDNDGAASIHLWGWKREAFLWFGDNQNEVYSTAMGIYDGYADPELVQHELLKYFASLPGLGLVKGGFVIQLCFGLSGCIDRHNLARFNIPVRKFDATRYKGARTNKTRNRIVREYHATVRHCGGTRALWDDWCRYVAKKYTSIYADAWAVSALHCEAIQCD